MYAVLMDISAGDMFVTLMSFKPYFAVPSHFLDNSQNEYRSMCVVEGGQRGDTFGEGAATEFRQ